MRESFWTREWFLGLVVGLVAVVAAALGQMHRLDYVVYDTAMRLASAAPTPRIAIIAVDPKSIDSLGSWPWPRNRLAELLDVIDAGKPTAVAAILPLVEPQIDPGLTAIHQLQNQYQTSSLPKAATTLGSVRHDVLLSARTMGRRAPQTLAQLDRYLRNKAPLRKLSDDLRRLRATVNELERHLNTDRILAAAIKRAGNVDLSMSFEPGITQGKPDAELPEAIRSNLLRSLAHGNNLANAVSAYAIQPPLPAFAEDAHGIGIFSPAADDDGRIRQLPLAVRYYGHYLPSLGLLLALQSLHLPADKVAYQPGTGLLTAGSLTIRTGPNLRIRPHFYRPSGSTGTAFTTYSFADVLNGNVAPEVFRDKIVLIGLTAPSVATQFDTAAGTRSPSVEILADEVSSVLNQDSFYTPGWAVWVRLVIWAAVLGYLIVLLPLLGNRIAVVATLLLFSALLIAMLYPLLNHGVWIALASPSLLLVCGQLLLLLKRRLSSGRGLLPTAANSIENARMLGLAFQGQGQLDLAFDRFRQLPAGEPGFELLYNLALDYERRRRFNKAHDVYSHIHQHDRHYRDVKERLKRTGSLNDVKLTPVRGNGGIASAGTIILESDGLQKPMLGRYEIDRELGRGAMSVVYAGRDPKIGRIVAIKTLPLSSEFDVEEIDQVKRRFYREAETAGRLNHPNIVTVYDVGEEHDLAYIAMEYLSGRNLTNFLNRKHLLPTSTVLEIIAKCAVALDYAHQHHVVHRDIKPANIVYDVDHNSVKLTDFGIARITDASRTKTGTVMGTPSYMSPEQLAGQRLDGRADLFSLGITCFQLLTGRLPFQADTMASLMYKITNEAHPALNSLRDDLAPCVSPIINKVLQKNPDRRFQTGREMAERLIQCAHEIRKMNA
ncbi:MAG: serine/threonine-protein kinase [Acidihalobacter sp.]|uniref:CHASE2 domain-containing serine/threonine-protein kinase n=1 Tax=Acidihalobacter sp. TaxID=1872108 RepID=UPI00307D41B1